jgi:hypothetical protein
MRKFFFLLFAFCTISVSARTSAYYNVRAGVEYAPTISHGEADFGFAFMFQPNICFGNQKQFTFSPTLQYDVTVGEEVSHRIHVPLLLGYRVRMGERSFFVPKIGPTLGYSTTTDNGDSDGISSALIGPYVDLCFELHRFVLGLGGYYSFISGDAYKNGPYGRYLYHSGHNAYALTLSFGYKF